MSEIKITPEVLQEIRRFNRNVEWLKKATLKDEYTATAGDVMKITGWSYERLRGEKKLGTIKFKEVNKRCRFNLSSLPSIYQQKVVFAKDQQQLPPLERA